MCVEHQLVLPLLSYLIYLFFFTIKILSNPFKTHIISYAYIRSILFTNRSIYKTERAHNAKERKKNYKFDLHKIYTKILNTTQTNERQFHNNNSKPKHCYKTAAFVNIFVYRFGCKFSESGRIFHNTQYAKIKINKTKKFRSMPVIAI